MLFLKFVTAAIIIFFCGSKLIKYAVCLSQKWGMAHHVMGALLLSLITALPELCVSSTTAYIGNADLSLGNLFGSNAFNIFIIVILDFVNKGVPIVSRVESSLFYTARLGIILTFIAVLGIALSKVNHLQFYHIGSTSIVIALIYVWRSKKIFSQNNKTQNLSDKDRTVCQKYSLLKFVILAAIIISAGIYLSHLSEQISLLTFRGTLLGGTLIGTFLLAIATSLPELAVTTAAVRKGLYSMALGNILGSNLVNMQNIFWADIFYRPGAILGGVSFLHILSGMLAISLTLIVAFGIQKRPVKRSFLKINPLTLAILIVYLAGFCLIFKFR